MKDYSYTPIAALVVEIQNPYSVLTPAGSPARAKEVVVIASSTSAGYELLFRSLISARRSFVFPCNSDGDVDMDSLSERSRNNYLYARAVMGVEVEWPDVRPTTH
jgi:hypothetical protein